LTTTDKGLKNMVKNLPDNTLVVLENPEIHDGWSAALLQNGEFVNRWDPTLESDRHQATEELIQQFLNEYEPKGFEGEW